MRWAFQLDNQGQIVGRGYAQIFHGQRSGQNLRRVFDGEEILRIGRRRGGIKQPLQGKSIIVCGQRTAVDHKRPVFSRKVYCRPSPETL